MGQKKKLFILVGIILLIIFRAPLFALLKAVLLAAVVGVSFAVTVMVIKKIGSSGEE